MASDHVIFKQPLPVELSYEEVPTPESYAGYYIGRNLGKTLKVWRVDQQGYGENSDLSPGVVAPGGGFADSPDCEVISSGMNSKGPDAVALGRQGPFFHWGFAASPKGMTPSGQKAFVNAICYIHRFDRSPVLVRKEGVARDVALDKGYRTLQLKQGYAKRLQWHKERLATFEAAKAAEGKRELTRREASALKFGAPRAMDSYEKFVKSHFDRSYPAALREELGTDDPSKYLDYYKANLAYVVGKQYQFSVDERVKALGIPNHDLRLLDTVTELWTADENHPTAQAILKRYTTNNFKSAAEAAAWLKEHRDYLFFSDVGGFKWFSQRKIIGHLKHRFEMLPWPRTSQRAPVASDILVFPEFAKPGDLVAVCVRLAIAPNWHIYAQVPEGKAYPPTRLTWSLPEGAKAIGDTWRSKARFYPDDPEITVYEDEASFTQYIRIPKDAKPGSLSIKAKVTYQACDPRLCLPPSFASLEAKVHVQ